MNISTFTLVLLIIFCNLISNVSSHTCVCAEFTAEKCNAKANCCWNEKVNPKGITKPGVGKCRSIKYLECKRNPKCTLKYNDPRTQDSPFVAEKVADLLSAYNELELGSDDYVPIPKDQDNGNEPDETTLDYPWVCKEDVTTTKAAIVDEDTDTEHGMSNNKDHGMDSSEKDEFCESWKRDDDDTIYAADPVDVSQIEIAAQRLYFAQKELNGITMKNPVIEHENISSKPGATYQSFTGLQLGSGIVFIVLLIAAMIYWQCNKDKMDKDGLQNRFINLTESNNKGTYSTFA